jgi:hypothetical protein
VLLRFYERRDLHAVGAVLGISDDAAQKRVARALEKLRAWLGRRGVTSSTAALAGLLGAYSATAAPAGTALAVTTGALATVAAGARTGTLTLVELMMHLKTKTALVAAAAVAMTATMVWQEHAIACKRAENLDRAAALEQLRSEPEVETAQAPTGAETEGAPDERAELERLRTRVAALRTQLEQARTARLAAAAKGGKVPLPENGGTLVIKRTLGDSVERRVFRAVVVGEDGHPQEVELDDELKPDAPVRELMEGGKAQFKRD